MSAEELVERREITETLVSIDAPHFNAGIVARNGKVIEAAPILSYMKGWDGKRVADYCKKKGWSWELVSATTARMMGKE